MAKMAARAADLSVFEGLRVVCKSLALKPLTYVSLALVDDPAYDWLNEGCNISSEWLNHLGRQCSPPNFGRLNPPGALKPAGAR